MSQNKFTPGPWVVDNSRHEGSINRLEPFRHIGMVSGFLYDENSRSENAANAQLISAAPDMLAALEKGISRLETCIEDERYMRDGSMTYLLEIFKDAVAKARGYHEQA